MRVLRKLLDIGLPVAGTLVVLAAIIFLTEARAQVAGALLGILMIEAGVWKLAYPLLPDERKYGALRAEVDRFLGLVRLLNAAALELRRQDTPETRRASEGQKTELRRSVERMVDLAGKTEADVVKREAS